MTSIQRALLVVVIAAFCGEAAAAAAPQYTLPKVRAITAFVRLDRASYRSRSTRR